MYQMLTLRHLPHARLGDRAGHHQHARDRRRLLADAEVDRDDQAEVHRIDADRAHQRHDDRNDQDDRRRRVQEHAEEEEQHVEQREHEPLVRGELARPRASCCGAWISLR